MSEMSDFEENEFEDDFDDNLDEFEEIEDQIVSPKLSAKELNVLYACRNSLPV